ncbi:polysaccharide biosynthesis tyrosine autokinase [Candidatus Marinimicrobia bacterium]|nr:polysaccharide biosynthesis tyrosine autokinase [Candidatus Neomarinimicrobiota bacterium]
MNNTDNNNIEERIYSVSEVYYLIKKHIFTISLISASIFILSIIYTINIDSQYSSSSTIIVSKDPNSMNMLDVGFGSNKNFIDNEIEILKSKTTFVLAVKELVKDSKNHNMYIFKNRKNLNSDSTIYKIAAKLSKSTSISNKRNTDAINISVTSHDYNEAAILTNTIVKVYKNRDLKWINNEMSHLKDFLIEQLELKEIELNEVEIRLKDFQEEEKIFSLDANSKSLLESLTSFETEYNKLIIKQKISEENENQLNNKLTNEEQDILDQIVNTPNQTINKIRLEMSVLEGEKISISSKYGINHSAVLDLEKQIKNLEVSLKIETERMLDMGVFSADPLLYRQSIMDSIISINVMKVSLDSQIDAFLNMVEKYNEKLGELPNKLLEFTRLERERIIHAETYSFMSQKLEEARIGEASQLDKIRVVDPGVPNNIPIYPDKKLNIILGFIFGISAGLGVALIIELLDNTIKSIEQLERRGLSILTMIPAIGKQINNKKTKKYSIKNSNVEKLQRRLITHEDPKSPISEAYRGLRTSLMYSKNEDNCNIILVSSPGPGEGKTTTIANLAITYANLGKRTLLIDSDLRKPVVHKVFNVDKTPGLTSYLTQNEKLSSIVNKTDIENLEVVTSGVVPPNPSELLDSKKMTSFIEEIKNEYDVVLFDSPPLIAVTDPYVLLKHIKQFVLVVRAGVTERGGLNRVLTAVEQSNLEVTGVVMNAMKEEHSYGAGYYYNYYQYYYAEK